MDRERFENELRSAEQVLRAAQGLVRAQEAEVRRMRGAGLDTMRAESLLAAYREGVRLAIERREAIEALARQSPFMNKDCR
jgi:hypothetical protein